ncbi:MAG: hypothetical protein NC244_10920 [Alistipes senegalensis]|nr:hypothetical protein [Alistipes senegalensis]
MDKHTNRKIVDTTNLKENMKVESYSKMCSLIKCEPVACGSPRIGQINNWKRYFNFTLSGHSYIISKIYDTPIPTAKEIRQQERQYIIDKERKEKKEQHEAVKVERERQTKEKAQLREERRQQRLKEEQERAERRKLREERKQAKANKVDGRKSRNGKYVTPIEILLMRYLHSKFNNNESLTMPMGYFYGFLGLTNSNYMTNKYRQGDWEDIKESYVLATTDPSNRFSDFDINAFYKNTASKLSHIVRSALNSMEKRNLITVTKEYVLVRIDNDKSITILNGDMSDNLGYEERVASADEVKRIQAAEQAVLKDVGLKNLGEVFLRGKSKQFYQMVEENLHKRKDDDFDYIYNGIGYWDGYYTRLSVSLNDLSTSSEKPLYLEQSELQNCSCRQLREQLNAQLIQYIKEYTQKQFDKSVEEYTKFRHTVNGKKEPFLYHSDYVEIQSYLIKYFLDITFSNESDNAESVDYYQKEWQRIDKENL